MAQEFFVRVVAARGRVFGLDIGDWSVLLGGMALIGLLALLI
jgi:hypothetical protein